MHYPGHSSGRICCPRCWVSSQLTAPSIQLLQGLPQQQRIISAKAMSYPRQPTSSDQSWWGYEGPAFWPIAEQLWWALSEACQACISVPFLPVPSMVLIPNKYPGPTLCLSWCLLPESSAYNPWFREINLWLICAVCHGKGKHTFLQAFTVAVSEESCSLRLKQLGQKNQ